MKGKICLIVLMLFMSSYVGFSQQAINNYSYIEVPDTFEFLRGKDQYQLNSLTKFLFNKYGFNAYFGNELPNVRKCDGVFAEVEGSSGFIYTRITVVVKDCNGLELFRSQEGKSKIKEYKRAYHQALRRAFESFEGLGISQPEIALSENNSASTNQNTKPTMGENTVSASNNVSGVSIKGNFPTARFSSYTEGGQAYLLRKTAEGYSLSQEVIGAEDDLLLVGNLEIFNGKVSYIDIKGAKSEAYFDADKNLIISLPSGPKTYVLVKN